MKTHKPTVAHYLCLSATVTQVYKIRQIFVTFCTPTEMVMVKFIRKQMQLRRHVV